MPSARDSNSNLAVTLRRIDLDRGGRAVLRDVDWQIRPGQRWLLIGGGHRDRETVVGHHVQHGQVQVAGRVQALPELAFAARPLAQAHVGELVAVRGQAQLGPARDVAGGFD